MGLLALMLPVLNRDEIRRYDALAIEQGKIPGAVLMENAGRSACEHLLHLLEKTNPHKKTIAIVCGPGNNGGDGFVLARHLLAQKDGEWKIRVLVLCKKEDFRGDAALNLEILFALAPEILVFAEPDDAVFEETLAHSGVIVDAIFGTGLSRPVEGKIHRAIGSINASGALHLALDIPSGLDCNTGCVLGIAVKAQQTITFAHAKPGLLTPQGRKFAGELVTVSLGFPDREIVHQSGQTAFLLEARDVAAWLSPRSQDTHKYRSGNVLVIAGSLGKTGAAKLASLAALRSGAGLSTLCTWSELLPALSGEVLEVMLCPLNQERIEASLANALIRRHAVVIGPGLGIHEHALAALTYVLKHAQVPLVIDADALTLLAENPQLAAHLPESAVLTPHSGELARLLGVNSETIESDRYGYVRRAAEKLGCVVMLKGAHTLIADKGRIFVSPWVNPVLATAGSGDVLSGIVAALLVHLEPIKAAAAAVYLHGQAAALWQNAHHADRGMLAGDLLEFLPQALFFEEFGTLHNRELLRSANVLFR